MNIRIKEDSVEITGYVNALERNSRPLRSRMGQFIERICKGAFKRAIERNDNIRILLNHNFERDLGGTKDGNLRLCEDNIGLRAEAIITDEEVLEKARNGELVGWSFGFADRDGGVEQGIDDDTKLPLRKVRDLDLYEVSILDNTKTPAYDGTLVAVRSDEVHYYGEPMISEIEIREDKPEQTETPPSEAIDYSEYENLIKEIKED